jgi:hypothetical protein
MIFLKDFFDEEGRVNTKNKWVWVVHFFSYSYIIYYTFFTGVLALEHSQSSKMWIPLDIILTINIAIYQLYYHMIQAKQDKIDQVDEDFLFV